MEKPLYGAIEAGGTKFVCALGTGPDDLVAQTRFPTTTPEETTQQAIAFFKEHGPIDAVGIASFGPIDGRKQSADFGKITTTPKPGWAQFDFVGAMGAHFDVPIAFDTDVNGAALAECRWGAARGLSSCLYITVGTGIGGGFVVNGQTLKGLLHPEMGHLRVAMHPDDSYEGHCPFHGTCLEGLAAGPAIEERWGKPAHELAEDHLAWDIESDYLGQALVSMILVLSPECVVLGGGVMQQAHLFPKIRARVKQLLNGYLQVPAILESNSNFICQPGLGTQSGILGALAMAMDVSA